MREGNPAPADRTWVILPTYEEAASIEPVVRGLRACVPGACVLVVDDSSPDGTARLVERLFGQDPAVHLLVRRGPRGRGRAGRDGLCRALEGGATRIVEMDADGSHRPEQVPELLAGLSVAPIVLASRFLSGASDDRGLARRALTRLANDWLQRVLGLERLDCTTGFRAFEARVLVEIGIEGIRAEGPEIVQEVLVRAVRRGFAVHQIPIRFAPRHAGRSKLDLAVLLGVLRRSWELRRELE